MLTSRYLGLNLRSPLIASSSPLSYNVDGIQRLEEAGIAGVVLFSIFEEQMSSDPSNLLEKLSQGGSYAETLSMYSDSERLRMGPVGYLDLIRRAKEKVSVPLIASMNGTDPEVWSEYPKLLEQAGADAIELNLYELPTDPEVSGEQVESRYVEVTRVIAKAVDIPVSVKLSPYFSSLPHIARRLVEAGAQGFVLFNRFYQPDVDLESEQVKARLTLSDRSELLTRLRWIGILRDQNPVDFAASGGIHKASDALKVAMVGGAVSQICSTLLEHGLGRIKTVETDMRKWLVAHEYATLEELRAKAVTSFSAARDAFERAQYLRTLESWDPDSIQRA